MGRRGISQIVCSKVDRPGRLPLQGRGYQDAPAPVNTGKILFAIIFKLIITKYFVILYQMINISKKYMKKLSLNTISLLLFFVYLFYSQFYPFVHIHTHEKDIQKPGIELRFHPVDDCTFGHECDDAHQKNHNHFVGAQNHTHIKVQSNTTNLLFVNISAKQLFPYTQSQQNFHQFDTIFDPQNVITQFISRAPPRIS